MAGSEGGLGRRRDVKNDASAGPNSRAGALRLLHPQIRHEPVGKGKAGVARAVAGIRATSGARSVAVEGPEVSSGQVIGFHPAGHRVNVAQSEDLVLRIVLTDVGRQFDMVQRNAKLRVQRLRGRNRRLAHLTGAAYNIADT